ncbi:hypothetical protein E2C01_053600 [Portunus trituberculatus]|uniref:Uncharacterized protein n=1 Tax=Portunus trituberculatus TaxID=210409 RepID=A0A5B7GPV8_PORTR|nr:hypothetical protein [Portunus trituberculatus]
MLDSVISDYQEDRLQCHQLGLVGSSDHHTVLTQLEVGVAWDETTTCTIWLWNKADWASLRHDLIHTPWATLLQGEAEREALALTSSPSRDTTSHTGNTPPDRRISHGLATIAVLLPRQSMFPSKHSCICGVKKSLPAHTIGISGEVAS